MKLLQLHRRDVNEVVNYRINGESCGTVYLQLTSYVAPVGDNGVDRDTQMIGYFLVSHSLHESHNHVLLALAKSLGTLCVLAYHA